MVKIYAIYYITKYKNYKMFIETPVKNKNLIDIKYLGLLFIYLLTLIIYSSSNKKLLA